jgi:hypothetical protein
LFGDGVIAFERAIHRRASDLEHQMRAARRASDRAAAIVSIGM